VTEAKPQTPEERLAELREKIAAQQARRDANKIAWALAHAEQLALDMERLASLEEEHGFERVQRFDVPAWNPGEGAATMVIARIPRAKEAIVKRFEQTSARAKEGDGKILDAGHVLARSCIVYPNETTERALYDATMELAAAMLSHVGVQVMKLVQGKAEEEKKG